MADIPASPSWSASEALEALRFDCQGSIAVPGRDGIPSLIVDRDRWSAVARRLRDSEALSYEMLVSLTCVDWDEREPRFEVVYHLWSLRHNELLRVKVGVPEEDPTCPSVVGSWPGADWQEREVFDMFGVRFEGHPDLRRILMPPDYPWHPLRKEFPLEGIDNPVSYRDQGFPLMTDQLQVDRPAGCDRTPVDRSRGDPEGYGDGAEEIPQ